MIRHTLTALLFANFALSTMAFAWPHNPGRQDGGDWDWHHRRKPREVTFNLFCRYEAEEGGRFRRCYSAARFEKYVTGSGEEFLDNSERPKHPLFEVECDGFTIFNSGARRFTDEQGTRIQGESGPFPATVLPENSLREGRRKVRSELELQDQTLRGFCLIYTGEP